MLDSERSDRGVAPILQKVACHRLYRPGTTPPRETSRRVEHINRPGGRPQPRLLDVHPTASAQCFPVQEPYGTHAGGPLWHALDVHKHAPCKVDRRFDGGRYLIARHAKSTYQDRTVTPTMIIGIVR